MHLKKPVVALPVVVLFTCGLVFAATPPVSEANSGNVLALLVFALVAVGFSFLCSVAEAVLLSVTPSHIAMMKEEGRRSPALLQELKDNIDRPLSAILSLNTIAHTVGAAGVGAQAAGIWGSQAVGWASAAVTLIILVFSEIIPKTLGAVHWRALAPLTARLVRFLIVALYPLVLLSDLITRLIGGRQEEVVTREEVAAMAALSEEKGEMESRESRILKNLFRLRALTAHDILTPRPVLIAYPEQMSVGELMVELNGLPVSRIPIYVDTIDQINGFVLKTDVLLAKAKDEPKTTLRELRRDIKTLPAGTDLSELFDQLLEQNEHIALVIDEYGGVEGLVTIEDVLETLLGMEIVDEADQAVDMRRLAREQWERRAKKLGLDVSSLQRKAKTEATDSDPSVSAAKATDPAVPEKTPNSTGTTHGASPDESNP